MDWRTVALVCCWLLIAAGHWLEGRERRRRMLQCERTKEAFSRIADEVRNMDDDYDDEPDDGLGHGYDCDCPDCTLEYHESECGRLPEHLGGGCQLAGTEYCDFDCPFRDED